MPEGRVTNTNVIWYLLSKGSPSPWRWPQWDSVGRPPEIKASPRDVHFSGVSRLPSRVNAILVCGVNSPQKRLLVWVGRTGKGK